MKKVLYLDCFSGAAGDMLCAALLDLGLKLPALEYELEKLKLPDHFHLHANRQQRSAISGIHFSVHDAHAHDHHHDHGHPHHHDHDSHAHSRTFTEIKELIERSGLS